MKKTAIALAVALAGFATVAQAAPKDNTWYTESNRAGPSTTTLVSTATVTRTVSATAQPTKISWVPARSWATRQTNTWASNWAMTGSAVCLTKAA